jgi:uncharacterized RDD family membrane protein YckC
MKCPKCGYIEFDSGARCRNCGYDFSLVKVEQPAPELPLRTEVAVGAPVDLELPTPHPLRHRRHARPSDLELDGLVGSGNAPPQDLPLFADGMLDVSPEGGLELPRPARPPLSVRRSTPPAQKLRPRAVRTASEPALPMPSPSEAAAEGERPTPTGVPASGPARVAAASIDLSILMAIDAAVLYFTLRLCQLTPHQILVLPLLPLLGFFVILNGGYFVAFNVAAGQSIGKMAAGIRVVGLQNQRIDLSTALLRTAASFLSAIPAGIGFLPILLGRSGRAFHDHLARTRVVRDSP